MSVYPELITIDVPKNEDERSCHSADLRVLLGRKRIGDPRARPSHFEWVGNHSYCSDSADERFAATHDG